MLFGCWNQFQHQVLTSRKNRSASVQTGPHRQVQRSCLLGNRQRLLRVERNRLQQRNRFKDHKKCSHMIANAMDGDGKFTAPQVCRKLKQLGLHIPRKKRPSGGMLKDADQSDSNANKMHDSDDETLFSLMKRGKKDRSKELPKQTAGREALEDDADDEILSSVLKRSLSKSIDQNSEAILIQGTESGTVLENEIDEGAAVKRFSLNGTEQAEVTVTGSGNPLDVGPVKNLEDLPHQEMDTDLADSEDEVGTLPVSGVSRRRSRMVLEDEDDD